MQNITYRIRLSFNKLTAYIVWRGENTLTLVVLVEPYILHIYQFHQYCSLSVYVYSHWFKCVINIKIIIDIEGRGDVPCCRTNSYPKLYPVIHTCQPYLKHNPKP